MSSIDNRVVKLVFDNSQFEKNASTSMKTIDKLKESLNFSGAAKGLDGLQTQVSNTNFDSLLSAIKAVEDRFSPLGIVGMTVFSELTKSAMQFASTMVNTVTNSIIGGGSKRAFALENARFTLQGLTKDAQEVQQVMDDALASVKGTAYGYGDAASAASQLFASGIQAGESMQTVLSGISGVAATTNSNYSEIAHIFTTIAGNGRLMTEQLNQFSYRGMNAAASLTNAFNEVLHGSSTLSEELQDHIRAAVEFGIAEIDDFGGTMEGITEGDLRKLVSKSAVQFDMFAGIMANTFGEHAFDANKTFNGSMENIQAALSRTGAKFYTELIAQEGPIVQLFNSIMKAIDAFNDTLDPAVDVWNRFVNGAALMAKSVVDTFVGSGGFEAVGTIVKFVSESIEKAGKIIREVFVGTEKLDLVNIVTGITAQFKRMTQTLEISENVWTSFRYIVEIIKNLFGGLANILSTCLGVLSAFLKAIDDSGALNVFLNALLGISTAFKDLTDKIKPTQVELTKLSIFFGGIAKLASTLYGILFHSLGKAFEFISRVLGIVLPDFSGFYDILARIGGKLYQASDGINNFYDILKERINLEPIIEFFERIKDSASSFINLSGAASSIRSFIDGVYESVSYNGPTLLDSISNGVQSLIDRIRNNEAIINALESIRERATNLGTSIRDSLSKPDFSMFEKIGEVLTSIKDKLVEAAPVIKNKVDEIRGSLANLVRGTTEEATKYDGLDIVGLLGLGGAAIIVKKLIGVFKQLKGGDQGGIVEGLLEVKDAVVDTFGSIQNTLKAGSLLAIAASIGVLAYSLTMVASIPSENLLGGIAAISVLVLEMRGVLSKLGSLDVGSIREMIVAVASLVVFSYAVKNLAEAVATVGGFSMESILKGLTVVTILIAELMVVARMLSKEQSIISGAAAALLAMSLAVLLMTKPIEILGSMDQEVLKQGLGAVAVMMAVMAGLAALSGKSGFGASAGLGLILMATSLLVMYHALMMFADIDWNTFASGMSKLGIAMLILATDAAIVGLGGFGFSAGAGLIAMAASLFVMYHAISLYSGMDLGAFASGLIKVGLALTAMTVAASFIGKTNFSVSDGLGLMAMGAAILILAAGIALLAGLPTLAVAASLAILLAALAGFGMIAMFLAPAAPILMQFAIAIGIFALSAVAIAAALMLIVVALGAFSAAIIGFLNTASEMIGPMIEAMNGFINAAADGIRENQDTFIDAIGNLLLALLELLGTALMSLGEWFVNDLWPWIMENGPLIVQGLVDGIMSLGGLIAEGASTLVENFKAGLEGLWPWIQENGPAIVQGLFDGIVGFVMLIGEAAGILFDEFCKAMEVFWPWLMENGPRIVMDLVAGIGEAIWHVAEAAGDIVDELLQGLGDGVEQMLEVGANFVQGFIDGILGGLGEVWNAACDVANRAWAAITGTLDEHSPSRVTYGGGENFTLGFINGILSLKDRAINETAGVALAVMDAFDSAIDSDYNPAITPVVDLSNIQNGIGSITSMFDSIPNTYGINGAIEARNTLNTQAMLSLESGADYGAILQGMLSIQADLARYNEMMSKLNIVMDTGTLVGQLTPGIDRQLGRNAMMAGRGVL